MAYIQKYYYVYLLRCADGSYYTGITNNVDRRLEEHNAGINPESYTHKRRPVELVYVETYKYVLDAIAREKQIKGWSRAKKEAMINSDWKTVKKLSRCHTSTPLSVTSTANTLHTSESRAERNRSATNQTKPIVALSKSRRG